MLSFAFFPPPNGAQLSLPPHQRAGPYCDVSQPGVSLPLSGLTVLLAPWACVPASPFTISRRRSSQIPVTLFPAAFVQVPGYAVFKVRLIELEPLYGTHYPFTYMVLETRFEGYLFRFRFYLTFVSSSSFCNLLIAPSSLSRTELLSIFRRSAIACWDSPCK